MHRKFIPRAAMMLSVLGLGAATAQAAPSGEGYVAALASPLAAPRQAVVGGLLWKCAGAQCAAPIDGSRPVLVCQRVAKMFGPVTRFSIRAAALSDEDISRCNAQS